jgi:hypothetical protein
MMADPLIYINKTINTGQHLFNKLFFLTKLFKNRFYYPSLFSGTGDIPEGKSCVDFWHRY